MLRLITDQPVIENPTLGVRWCLDPKDKAKLIELKATNVKVFIVVKYENASEDRQLCDLGDAMTFVTFRSPGAHQIFACLVWSSDTKTMEKRLLERHSRSRYENNVLDYYDSGFRDLTDFLVRRGYLDIDSFEMDVEVGKEHFAKEPSALMKWWVNLPYPYPAVDQCDFRKRKPAAFTIQPPLVLLYIVARSFFCAWYAMIALSLLARGFTLRPILHPFDSSISDIWPRIVVKSRDGQSSYYGRSAWSLTNEFEELKLQRYLISPQFVAIAFGAITALCWKLKMGYLELLESFIMWLGGHFTSIVLAVLILGVVLSAIYVLDKVVGSMTEKQKKLKDDPEYQAKMEEIRKKALEEAYRYLTCPMTPDPALAVNISALPPKRRTLRLRFLALKREVCRPYAR